VHKSVPVALSVLLGLLIVERVPAQDKPLRVEIVTAAPNQRDPILVRVTNVTATTIELAFPVYSFSRGRYQAAPSDPVAIERRKRLGWEEIASALRGRVVRASPQIAPGETKEYEIGVPDAGEYRVRVWYVVSPPDPGPPPRPAGLGSVASAPIRVK
jgi:hypothetical protein